MKRQGQDRTVLASIPAGLWFGYDHIARIFPERPRKDHTSIVRRLKQAGKITQHMNTAGEWGFIIIPDVITKQISRPCLRCRRSFVPEHRTKNWICVPCTRVVNES